MYNQWVIFMEHFVLNNRYFVFVIALSVMIERSFMDIRERKTLSILHVCNLFFFTLLCGGDSQFFFTCVVKNFSQST